MSKNLAKVLLFTKICKFYVNKLTKIIKIYILPSKMPKKSTKFGSQNCGPQTCVLQKIFVIFIAQEKVPNVIYLGKKDYKKCILV